MQQQFVSTVEMTYGGRAIERGEILELAGLRNDQKLRDYRYLRPLESEPVEPCGDCGKIFVNLGLRDAHRLKQHPVREVIEVGGPAYKRGPRSRVQDRASAPMDDRAFAARTEV